MDLERHLNPDGSALVVLSSDSDLPGFHQAIEKYKLSGSEFLKKRIVGETFSLFRISTDSAAPGYPC
jgi:hypothetical protein